MIQLNVIINVGVLSVSDTGTRLIREVSVLRGYEFFGHFLMALSAPLNNIINTHY
jgi:hypothetical protein